MFLVMCCSGVAQAAYVFKGTDHDSGNGGHQEWTTSPSRAKRIDDLCIAHTGIDPDDEKVVDKILRAFDVMVGTIGDGYLPGKTKRPNLAAICEKYNIDGGSPTDDELWNAVRDVVLWSYTDEARKGKLELNNILYDTNIVPQVTSVFNGINNSHQDARRQEQTPVYREPETPAPSYQQNDPQPLDLSSQQSSSQPNDISQTEVSTTNDMPQTEMPATVSENPEQENPTLEGGESPAPEVLENLPSDNGNLTSMSSTSSIAAVSGKEATLDSTPHFVLVGEDASLMENVIRAGIITLPILIIFLFAAFVLIRGEEYEPKTKLGKRMFRAYYKKRYGTDKLFDEQPYQEQEAKVLDHRRPHSNNYLSAPSEKRR